MRHMSKRTCASELRLRLLAGAALVALLQPGLAEAATVGTAGAANTRSTGTPPGGGLRVIEIGTQVVANEKIETSASGSVQLLFIDKTTLNIGPNSSLVIDKFVFNPATAQGEMAVTLGKGVLRVVGGQATHTGGGTVTTPVATDRAARRDRRRRSTRPASAATRTSRRRSILAARRRYWASAC